MRFHSLPLHLLPFLSSTLASLPNLATSPYQLVGYWGQNLAHSQFYDDARQEPPLATFCQTTDYTVYHLSFMTLHFDAKGNPGVHFANHCQWPTNKFDGYPAPTKGFNSLSCPDVAKDIKVCQGVEEFMKALTGFQ
ncbi:hypothetical protein HK104_000479 [Borealophlyctis nickersoniae]|nr:hypothetical protein HK104_000479 [Borealophlyctis nickersoniae]